MSEPLLRLVNVCKAFGPVRVIEDVSVDVHPGRVTVLLGENGAGKSTHVQGVADAFRAAGRSVVQTREPGGTALAETLRGLVLSQPMDALTESLLVFAARRDHLLQVIEPALARGDAAEVHAQWSPLIAALDPADPRRQDLERRLPQETAQ